MNNAIEIRGLEVALNGFTLKNVNMDIPKGVVVGLIGKNGAGKTTLIKTITDVYLPTKGTVTYDGLNMYDNAVEIKQKLGIVYDEMYYPSGVRSYKIAKMIAPLYPDFDMNKWHELMKKFMLDEKKRPIEYSKGMQMKFMLAMVLARNPKILILDEPTAGMDPAARAEFLDLLQEYMMDETNTIIFSTHITSDLDKIADYIALVSDGELVVMEEKEKLLMEYSIVQVTKSAMTDELRRRLVGVKENAFGFTGLATDLSGINESENIRFKRPTVEDLIVYGE